MDLKRMLAIGCALFLAYVSPYILYIADYAVGVAS